MRASPAVIEAPTARMQETVRVRAVAADSGWVSLIQPEGAACARRGPGSPLSPADAARRRTAAATPAGLRTRAGSDRAGRATVLLALQCQAGNRAVAELVTTVTRRPSPRRRRRRHAARRDRQLRRRQFEDRDPRPAARPAATDCPPDQGCRAHGHLVDRITTVDVTIRMPDVPGGLTACQERRVRAWLRDVLGRTRRTTPAVAHLQRHHAPGVRHHRLRSVGGAEKVQEMHDTEAEDRAKKADAQSLAIDPFTREIDLDCT